ncbi:MAG: hypothetical protein ACI9NC_005805, partial [Verrucomicrobiales bacterium]
TTTTTEVGRRRAEAQTRRRAAKLLPSRGCVRARLIKCTIRGLRRDKVHNFLQPTEADALGLARQPPPLVIREFWPTTPLLLFQHPDLLLQLFDHVLLLLTVHPTRQRHQNEFECVHRRILALFRPVKRTESGIPEHP